MKKLKASLETHVSNTKQPSGDYYGTGVKNPTGRLRDSYITPDISPKKLGKPPKKLA